MFKVEIYTTNYCPYCVKAKVLLKKKGINFTEIEVKTNQDRLDLVKKSGGKKTVPQIFINDKNIGGCDDLYQLDQENKLDNLLKIN